MASGTEISWSTLYLISEWVIRIGMLVVAHVLVERVADAVRHADIT